MKLLISSQVLSLIVLAGFATGCWKAPPVPPEAPSNFEFVAPVLLNEKAQGYFRFDLPESAAIRYTYGRTSDWIAIFDANDMVMPCGNFRSETLAMANRVARSPLNLTRLTTGDARLKICSDDSGKKGTFCEKSLGSQPSSVTQQSDANEFYEMDFSPPIWIKSQVVKLKVHWLEAPHEGWSIQILKSDGTILSENPIPHPDDAGSMLEWDEFVISRSPEFAETQLFLKINSNHVGIDAAELLTLIPRETRDAHWFEARGLPPYRLAIDHAHGNCRTTKVNIAELPSAAANEDWPPIAAIGEVKKTDRSVLAAMRAATPDLWWRWLCVFIPLWVAGLLVALVLGILRRKGA